MSVHGGLRKALIEAHQRWLDTGEECELTGIIDGQVVEVPHAQQKRLWAVLGLPLERSSH